MKINERVSIYTRVLKDGTESLYLNYRIGGVRHRDNLGLHLVKEDSQANKIKNIETWRLAKAIRDKKELDIEQMEAGIAITRPPVMVEFVQFARRKLHEMNSAERTIVNREVTVNMVEAFSKGASIAEVNRDFVSGFIRHMKNSGSKNSSIRKRVNDIKILLKMAVLDGLIPSVPNFEGLVPKCSLPEKVFLTLDELRALKNCTEVNQAYKNAFIFCCFTGLRFSDIVNLKPEDIHDNTLRIVQKKTGEIARVPLSRNAIAMLPERMVPGKPIFTLPHQTSWVGIALKRAALKCGITKNISFHTARHTCATLLLSSGADLYTVSKILGHRNVATTQVYAKVLDEGKKKAVDMVPDL